MTLTRVKWHAARRSRKPRRKRRRATRTIQSSSLRIRAVGLFRQDWRASAAVRTRRIKSKHQRHDREGDRQVRDTHDQHARGHRQGKGNGRGGSDRGGERRKLCNVMSGLSPISFEFVAAGVARRARVALAHLVPSQVNKEVPSWKGHDGTIEGQRSQRRSPTGRLGEPLRAHGADLVQGKRRNAGRE